MMEKDLSKEEEFAMRLKKILSEEQFEALKNFVRNGEVGKSISFIIKSEKESDLDEAPID